jgi:hypothetical protein
MRRLLKMRKLVVQVKEIRLFPSSRIEDVNDMTKTHYQERKDLVAIEII